MTKGNTKLFLLSTNMFATYVLKIKKKVFTNLTKGSNACRKWIIIITIQIHKDGNLTKHVTFFRVLNQTI